MARNRERHRAQHQLRRLLTLAGILADSRWPMELDEIQSSLNAAVDVGVVSTRTIRRDLELLTKMDIVRPVCRCLQGSIHDNTTVWRWVGASSYESCGRQKQ